jgi:hypothetical protein
MREMGQTVSGMLGAVASLEQRCGTLETDRERADRARAELAAWTAKRRAAREASGGALVSALAPATALEAWRLEMARRYVRG